MNNNDNFKEVNPRDIPCPNPICPINMFFEGDEDKCDTGKCNWDIDTRSCNMECRVEKNECNHPPSTLVVKALKFCPECGDIWVEDL